MDAVKQVKAFIRINNNPDNPFKEDEMNEVNDSMSSDRPIDSSFEKEVFQASMDFNNNPDILKHLKCSDGDNTPKKMFDNLNESNTRLP